MLHTLLSLAVVLAGQAAGPASDPAKPQGPPSFNAVYQIGPTDVLGIKVFGEDNLSNNYTVDSDGSITFPLIGRIQVAGKTTREIEEHVTKLLAPDYIRRAQVSVEIATYRSRSIYVIGEVRNPGRYSIQGPQTLLEVIAHAGSTTPKSPTARAC